VSAVEGNVWRESNCYFGYNSSLNTGVNILVHPSFMVCDDLGILCEFFNNDNAKFNSAVGRTEKNTKAFGPAAKISRIPGQ
jgi:hypothetical protein